MTIEESSVQISTFKPQLFPVGLSRALHGIIIIITKIIVIIIIIAIIIVKWLCFQDLLENSQQVPYLN